MAEASNNLAIGLVHFPVYNKHREIVTTAVTNLDIHDIARSSRTFGVEPFFIITPSLEQQQLTKKITGHWQEGWGATYNPDRKKALEIIEVVNSVSDAIDMLKQKFDKPVKLVVTAAKSRPGSISAENFKEHLQSDEATYLLLFGTGWGLSDQCFNMADMVLDPITGLSNYNHLSVRSAAAIMLDRLKGS